MCVCVFASAGTRAARARAREKMALMHHRCIFRGTSKGPRESAVPCMYLVTF